MDAQVIGSMTSLANQQDVSKLEKGMDFRKTIYRREVFLRFYEFHLKYKSHPGGVYFAMPYIAKSLELSVEQILWMGFINGCSQNIVTTYMILQKFPTLKDVNTEKLDDWWNANQHKFKSGSGWDSDRKYFKVGKTGFVNCVRAYKELVNKYGSQKKMFDAFTDTGDKYKNFEKVWDLVRHKFFSFGRLSTFSYTEYLRILGIPIDCNNLFLEDMEGSKSHRNGLCKVLGRDDLDWWDAKESSNKDFPGYEKQTIQWLKKEADVLLEQARKRIYHPDVSFFTLESTLCCYKSWHRPNRRYPNVYMDMFHNRIRYAESEWGEKFEIFWKMRRENLPEHLRLEDNPRDPTLETKNFSTLNPIKQNHYRETGQVIMMDKEWDCFENEFNNKYY